MNGRACAYGPRVVTLREGEPVFVGEYSESDLVSLRRVRVHLWAERTDAPAKSESLDVSDGARILAEWRLGGVK